MNENIQTKIYKARREIERLENEKAKLLARKPALNNHIIKMKEKAMLEESTDDYRKMIAGKQKAIKDIIYDINKKVSDINKEQKQWRAIAMSLENGLLDNIRKNGSIYHDGISESAITNRIETLRDKYLAFSADFTRVNSMRLMAAQFSDDLTDILSAS